VYSQWVRLRCWQVTDCVGTNDTCPRDRTVDAVDDAPGSRPDSSQGMDASSVTLIVFRVADRRSVGDA